MTTMKHTPDEQHELEALAQYFEPEDFAAIHNHELDQANQDRAAERIRDICRRAVERG